MPAQWAQNVTKPNNSHMLCTEDCEISVNLICGDDFNLSNKSCATKEFQSVSTCRYIII